MFVTNPLTVLFTSFLTVYHFFLQDIVFPFKTLSLYYFLYVPECRTIYWVMNALTVLMKPYFPFTEAISCKEILN